jgi:hypothetical protein
MDSGMRLAVITTLAVATSAECGSSDLRPILDAPGLDAANGGGASNGDAASFDASAPPGDGGNPRCKRGIAANDVPSAAFAPTASSPGVSWWYNWASKSPGASTGIEFVPMIWGGKSLNDALPPASKYLLGFNEPNFKTQSNMTAEQAAADWPTLQAHAKAAGIPIVSPSVSYCGSSTDTSQCTSPQVTDPYTYLKDFFAACPGCEVDYVAVHSYNCDVPSLRAYLEGDADAGPAVGGFLQFGRPIWLTEFACDLHAGGRPLLGERFECV